MRLERRLQLGRRIERELDRDVGRGEGRLGVATSLVGRVLGEALLVEPLLHVDEVRQNFEIECKRGNPCPRRFERVRCHDGDRRPGIRGLGGEERRLRRQRQLALRPDHGTNAGRGARRFDVERSHAAVRGRRSQDSRVQHPRELHVDREAHAARRARRAVLPRCGLARRARDRRRAPSSSSRRSRRRAPRRPRSGPPSPSAS